jgi:hypothetical protein
MTGLKMVCDVSIKLHSEIPRHLRPEWLPSAF